MAQQHLVDQDLLIIEASRSHPDTPHSVGLLRTTDKPDAENFIWQHSTKKRDRFETAVSASERMENHVLNGVASGIKEPFVDLNNPSQHPVFQNRPLCLSSSLPAFNRSNPIIWSRTQGT